MATLKEQIKSCEALIANPSNAKFKPDLEIKLEGLRAQLGASGDKKSTKKPVAKKEPAPKVQKSGTFDDFEIKKASKKTVTRHKPRNEKQATDNGVNPFTAKIENIDKVLANPRAISDPDLEKLRALKAEYETKSATFEKKKAAPKFKKSEELAKEKQKVTKAPAKTGNGKRKTGNGKPATDNYADLDNMIDIEIGGKIYKVDECQQRYIKWFNDNILSKRK